MRQWENLKAATRTQAAMDELAARLGARLNLEGERYLHRQAITEVLAPFFAARRVEDLAALFDAGSVTWARYRSFRQTVEEDPDCSPDNPMFSMVEHPGLGAYLTPGTPAAFSDLDRTAPSRAPSLGENTDEILAEIGYDAGEIARLHDGSIVAGPR